MKNYHYKRKNCKFIDATDEILKSYNESNTPKRNRIKLSEHQLDILENSFLQCQHPCSFVKEKISHDLYIPIKNIQIWFQNRRARSRTERETAHNKLEKRKKEMNYMDMMLNEEEVRKYNNMERLRDNITPTWYEDSVENNQNINRSLMDTGYYSNEYYYDPSINWVEREEKH